MTIYSYSKLQTFEQCKQKYKFKYLDKIIPEIEKSIEAHLGSCVHNALEWLYKKVLENEIPDLNKLIEEYTNLWQQNYKENFLIVKKELKPEDYYNKGIKFLIDYYLKHSPFNDGTIEMGKKIEIELHPDFPHKIMGYIDRLSYNSELEKYEIHDYKTANNLPEKEKLEKDRQLALYSIAIKKTYNFNKPVTLKWHFLNFNQTIEIVKKDEELEILKKKTIGLINEIEATKEFPTNKSILCDWCEYKDICPAFKKEDSNKHKIIQEKDYNLKNINKNYPTVSKYLRE